MMHSAAYIQELLKIRFLRHMLPRMMADVNRSMTSGGSDVVIGSGSRTGVRYSPFFFNDLTSEDSSYLCSADDLIIRKVEQTLQQETERLCVQWQEVV